jgi:hypothetical protein
MDTKAKCRYLEKMSCKWTLRQVFFRVYRLVIQLVMLGFWTQLCEHLPSNLLFGSISPPPPSLCA